MKYDERPHEHQTSEYYPRHGGIQSIQKTETRGRIRNDMEKERQSECLKSNIVICYGIPIHKVGVNIQRHVDSSCLIGLM